MSVLGTQANPVRTSQTPSFHESSGIRSARDGDAIGRLWRKHEEAMKQIESHLLMRHYEGFMKRGKLKARIS